MSAGAPEDNRRFDLAFTGTRPVLRLGDPGIAELGLGPGRPAPKRR